MEEKPQPIRPALDTLRELDGGQFLEKLAMAIHQATGAVTAHARSGKIKVTVTVMPFKNTQLVEPAIMMRAKIETDLPEADDHTTLFFVTADGNPSTQQQRQRELSLKIAGAGDHTTNEVAQGGKAT